MRPEDLTDLIKLRRLASNPLEVVRFRKGQKEGQELTVALREGGPLYLRGGCADFHIFLRDEYRLRGVAQRSWELVLDIGANVGIFSALAWRLAQRVVAFEPLSENFEQLSRNVVDRGITAVREAVGGSVGRLRIYRPVSRGRTGVSSAFPTPGVHDTADYEEVAMTSLDAVFERFDVERCDLLKIDVEGAEYDILHGASDGTLAKIQRIHGEYHDVEPDQPRTRIDAFSAFIKGKGFEVEVVAHPKKPNHGMFYAARA
jgi:FkbM family methyltransferase